MKGPGSTAWGWTVGPVYRRLFRRFFEAIISRLNGIFDEVLGVRANLRETRADLGTVRTEVANLSSQVSHLAAERHNLENQVRALLAVRWDNVALARRLAALEDQLDSDGSAEHPVKRATGR